MYKRQGKEPEPETPEETPEPEEPAQKPAGLNPAILLAVQMCIRDSTTMLQNQLARGNNGLIKTKYLTFGIDADSLKAAKPLSLIHI